jgi:hemoglobin-like flavoprotein
VEAYGVVRCEGSHIVTQCTVPLFQLIGPQFIQAIKPSLEDRWTDELHEAWLHLFKYIAYVLKTSMAEEEQRVNAQQ